MRLRRLKREKPAVAFIIGLGGLVTVIHLAGAQTWTNQTGVPGDGLITTFTASADGVKLLGLEQFSGYCSVCSSPVLVISTNAGNSWFLPNAWLPSRSASSFALSADGSKMAAFGSDQVVGGQIYGPRSIYLSSDSGVSWAQSSAPSNYWSSIALSADGTKLVAAAAEDLAANPGRIYRSADSGGSWALSGAPSRPWSALACSADGTRLMATDGTRIYGSRDFGATWAETSAPATNWVSLVSSADGNTLMAAANQVYSSNDAGTTWTPAPLPSSQNAAGIACSADGTKLAAAVGGALYISRDSGRTWVSVTDANLPTVYWQSVASSGDGANILAGGYQWITGQPQAIGVFGTLSYGGFPTSFPPPPQVSIHSASANLLISWQVPANRFVLQESPSLSPPDWMAVTNQPMLNLTNLHNELFLLLPGNRGFYRLKQQP